MISLRLPSLALVLLFALCAVVHAGEPLVVPAGTTFVVETGTDISSRTAQVGDHIQLFLVHPVTIKGSGNIPRGAKITARVMEVSHSTPQQKKGRLALIAESVEWNGGSAMLQALPISAVKKPGRWGKGLMTKTVATGINSSVSMDQESADSEPSPVEDPKPLDVNPGLAFENANGDTQILPGSTFIIRQLGAK